MTCDDINIKQEHRDDIMTILISYNEKDIKKILNKNGFTEGELFAINEVDNGKYDVTLGFNSYGEDVCSKEFNTHLDAYRFTAIRTLLDYDINSY